MDEQVADAERTLLANHLDAIATQAVLAEKYGIHVKTARTWLKRVRQKWADEASNADPQTRDERRGEMRAILRSYMVLCASSEPADMSNAAKFCKLLIDFDALNEVPEIRVSGRVVYVSKVPALLAA